MPKFFQSEIAALNGEKNTFQNVKFKKTDFENSSAAEAGTILEIIPVHIKNPPVIQFIAYLDSISDRFSPTYTSVQPFGRTDPYHVWKSNTRSISVSFSIPSSSVTSGLDNLNNLSWFLGALYPTYKDMQSTTSIAASPMFRVRFANLICSSTNDGQGLLGVIKGVSVNPEVKNGFINASPQNMGTALSNDAARLLKEAGFDNNISEGKKILIPKLMKVSFSIDVVHDHPLGWDFHTGEWRGGDQGPRFPHDFGLNRDARDTPSAGEAVFEGPTNRGDQDLTGAPANSQTAQPTEGARKREEENKGKAILGDTAGEARGAEVSNVNRP